MVPPHTGTSSPTCKNRLLTVVAGVLLIAVSLAHGYPMASEGRELDSAVEGVQKYLESSGFPKMTRGEVLDFLADFSRNARVSRSENAKKRSAAIPDATVEIVTPTVVTTTVASPKSPTTPKSFAAAAAAAVASNKPRFPAGESPLNYGYPMSSAQPKSAEKEKEKHAATAESVMRAIGAAKKSGAPVGPSVDLNAYAKFKKIPEAKNLKIDDDMRSFLGGFGLVDGKAATTTTTTKPQVVQRRADDVITTDEPALDDVSLLRSVLHETGLDKVNGSGSSRSLRFPLLTDIPTAAAAESKTRDHVFNPSDPDVRTVDVNRIAKIVANIRLLADDNDTVSLSQEAIQKKLENITAAIAAIDDQQPQAQESQRPAPNKAFDGYEVFFDDEDSKEVDSDLPEAPTGSMTGPGADILLQQLPLNHKPAHYPPPDPLSTDELQHLLEKNKHEVKRQEPAAEADDTTTTTTSQPQTTSEAVVTVTAVSMDAAAAAATDSSSEATASEATSSEATEDSARDSSTAAASDVGSPSLSQLAESFGGGETASSAPPAEEEVAMAAGPDRPKSGLYFYVDWNSFLTVNSGQKNQVNLRFAPKAGNANHFIKVNVP